MNEPENFLSRWSRRKQAAVEDPVESAPSALQPAPQAPAAAAETDLADANGAASVVANPPVEAAEPLFDPKSLPPIESITAETDIRGFLSPGVPPELARAALGRAWAADPKIRDFVGLADYAWDYHAPGSMLGFGPLEMTEELRQAVARIVGSGDAEVPMRTAKPAAVDGVPYENTNEFNASAMESRSSEPVAAGDAQDCDANKISGPTLLHDLGPSATEITAVQHDHEQSVTLNSTVRRAHGGALPR